MAYPGGPPMRQGSTSLSAYGSAVHPIGASPGRSSDSGVGRERVLRCVLPGGNEQFAVPSEVRVKNTFIHVANEDGEESAKPFQRSRSDKVADRPPAPMRLDYEDSDYPPVMRSQSDRLVDRPSALLRFSPETFDASAGLSGMFTPQNSASHSMSAIGPPPGLSCGCGGRRQSAPAEVSVKNTFLHVDDGEREITFQRSRSDKVADRRPVPIDSDHEDLDCGAPVRRSQSDRFAGRPSAPMHVNPEAYEFPAGVPGMLARQSFPSCSASAFGPPPGLACGCGGELRQTAPAEVFVKNTFLHVDDGERELSFQRSRSDKVTDRPSARMRLISEGADEPVHRSQSDKVADRPLAPVRMNPQAFDPRSVQRCQSENLAERRQSPMRVNPEGFDFAPGVAGLAAPQVSPSRSASSIGPPPGLACASGARRQPVPAEVQVKNTFLHIDDGETEISFQRSRSDRVAALRTIHEDVDVPIQRSQSNKVPGRSSTPLRVSPEAFEPARGVSGISPGACGRAPVQRCQNDEGPGSTSAPLRVSPEAFAPNVPSMAKMQRPSSPSPDASLGHESSPEQELPFDSRERLEQILRSLLPGPNEQPSTPAEVQVKNTFIHVDDDEPAKPFQRSKSDKVTDKARLRTIHEDLDSSGSVPVKRVHSDNVSGRAGASARTKPEAFHPARGVSSGNHEDFGRAQGDRSKTDKAAEKPPPFARASYEGFHHAPGASGSARGKSAGRAPAPPPAAPPPAEEPAPEFAYAGEEGQESEREEGQEFEQEDEEWSVGSAQHAEGRCKPCAFHRRNGCTKGSDCLFCHMPHERRIRARPCKATRAQCKQMVAMLESFQVANHDQTANDLLRQYAACGATPTERSYLTSVIRSNARVREGRFEQNEAAYGSAVHSVPAPLRQTR